MRALFEWNSQKDLTRAFVSLLLFLCNPRWLAWLCVTNQSKGTSRVCQNRIFSAQSLESIQGWWYVGWSCILNSDQNDFTAENKKLFLKIFVMHFLRPHTTAEIAIVTRLASYTRCCMSPVQYTLFRNGKNIRLQDISINIENKTDLNVCRVGVRGGELAIYLISKISKRSNGSDVR